MLNRIVVASSSMRLIAVGRLAQFRSMTTITTSMAKQTTMIRRSNTIRQISTIRILMNDATSPSSSASPSSSSACGSSGCACAVAAAASSSSSSSASHVKSGCGSSGCSCSQSAPTESSIAAAEEHQRLSSDIGALQSRVRQLYSIGQYEDALIISIDCTSRTLELFGDDHPAYASALNNEAMLRRVHRQEFGQALEMYIIALKIYKDAVGDKHPSYLTCMNNIGLTYRSLGDLPSALSSLTAVLESYDSSLSALDAKTSLPLAQSCMSVAGVHCDLAEYDRAIELHRRALSIIRRCRGDEHAQSASAMNNLAYTMKCAKDYAGALPLYEKALGIRSRNLPSTHPDVIISMNNIAECLLVMGKTKEADEVQQKMMHIMEQNEIDRIKGESEIMSNTPAHTAAATQSVA